MPSKKTTKTTKKTTARKSVKKTAKATKKTTKKSDFKALVCAVDGECFWTTDGTVLQNLDELRLAFAAMGNEVFLHHVTKEKNDFADWVEHVLQDKACADALRKAKKPATSHKVVVKCLKYYEV